MHSHDTHKIALTILSQIAREEGKSLSSIKKLFAVKHNINTTYRFWEILSETLPHHPYTHVYCCPGCQQFSLE